MNQIGFPKELKKNYELDMFLPMKAFAFLGKSGSGLIKMKLDLFK